MGSRGPSCRSYAYVGGPPCPEPVTHEITLHTAHLGDVTYCLCQTHFDKPMTTWVRNHMIAQGLAEVRELEVS